MVRVVDHAAPLASTPENPKVTGLAGTLAKDSVYEPEIDWRAGIAAVPKIAAICDE
jgi:hypothetical protein